MNLADYFRELELHDWYYEFSDDHSVWTKAKANEKRLIALRLESPQHAALYDAFLSHYSTGPAWGNEKTPKPVLESYLGAA